MNKKIINLIIIITLLVFVGLSGYFYYQLKNIKNMPSAVSELEAIDILGKVSKLYLIPDGEEPTIATVSDPSVLKGQSFFNLAEKGDKVLIFTKASKAVLYRPSIDKIIEIAPTKNNSIN